MVSSRILTVISSSTSHLPSDANIPELATMVVRSAIAAVRATGRREFGDLGSLHADVSDGSQIAVINQAASDGLELMASQRIVRLDNDGRIVRFYRW